MPLCRYAGFSLVLRQIHDTKLCPVVRATCIQNNIPDCQNLPWSSFESVALTYLCKSLGFPCGSAGKESARNARDLGSVPGLGRSPGEGKSYPLQYSSLENFMDSIVHGVTKSQTWLSDFQFYTSLWGLTCLALKPEKSLWPQLQSSVVWMPQLTFTSESLKVCLQYHYKDPPLPALKAPIFLFRTQEHVVFCSAPAGRSLHQKINWGHQLAIPSF